MGKIKSFRFDRDPDGQKLARAMVEALRKQPDLDESESIHERSSRRADEVTRWDGGER